MFGLASLVPSSAEVMEVFDSTAGTLLPEEYAALGNVADKRRREFTSGRECAHSALSELGIGPAPILFGAAMEPLWPPGICGSITHCQGYVAAVVARRVDVHGIGIDAESRRALGAGVFERISLPEERAWIGAATPLLPWELLLFSAKESVFKVWYPLVGTMLGFRHARIEFDSARAGFRAMIHPDAPRAGRDEPSELGGRFCVSERHVLTSAFILTKEK
ncbi:4'-phosphopantetheinyl transferase family protein [Bradyrhizobium canariense]|uniref:4'-phosphopantetheinyl transferase family protein n=1 Tax=Bradyrhizobium canariense TaxID=255045 RepID=UPI001B8A5117|nr:4'-phosphopantetheinyl transferase superfamily protein [Bradyrhizobium canariense]MBR0955330.1 4'-phosphopantetheinyl transferase superfamily protein [Bradyrhizobium canariense]